MTFFPLDCIGRRLEFKEYEICEVRAGEALRPEAQQWLIDGLVKAMPELKIMDYFRVHYSALREASHLSVAVDRLEI